MIPEVAQAFQIILRDSDEHKFIIANFIETLMAKIIFRKCVQLIRLQENLLSPLFGGLEPRFVTPGLVTDRVSVSVGSGSGLCLGHPDYHSPLTNRHHHSHDSHQCFPRTLFPINVGLCSLQQ